MARDEDVAPVVASHRCIRVLVVDDSALMRKVLTSIIDGEPGIEVIGEAVDPFDAREKIKALRPDVITLDIEMPRMDGLQFLSNLMRLRPMPVVMVSKHIQSRRDFVDRAIELGAAGFVDKPALDPEHGLYERADALIAEIRRAALGPGVAPGGPCMKRRGKPAKTVVAIGASTGGTEAIRNVVTSLEAKSMAVVITQHIPPVFSASFASRLNEVSGFEVSEASDGLAVELGRAIVAPGDRHLQIVRADGGLVCKLLDTPPVGFHKPSVDVMFDSLADTAVSPLIAVMLTGMGRDGAKGMRRLYEGGAVTIAQDEATSAIWGMPKAAIDAEAVQTVLPLQEIGPAINAMIRDAAQA